MKILVVGGGGREHALCWKIAASPLCEQLFCAPGNAGIAQDAACVPIGAEDVEGQVAFAKGNAVDFVVVGPEAPLVAGLVDRLSDEGIKAFGPSAAAAMLEGSKGFVKDLCAKHGVPTAEYGRFVDAGSARSFIRETGVPVVIKADGLAAGKGVTVATSQEEASFFALVDGETVLPLASAQDHKRVGDGETGPNTGGMGAYSPAPVMSPEMERRVMDEIVTPTVLAMKAEGQPYKGVLYAGLMITEEGPKLIEFNVRFGDPECQVLMPRLMSDLLPALIASADGVLANLDLRWHDEAAMTVVMAANGYPGSYEKGSEIRGLEAAAALDGVVVFHAGTKAGAGGTVLANGGRVLDVTATAPTVAEARARAYAAVDLIDWPEGFCRRDIGWRALEPEG